MNVIVPEDVVPVVDADDVMGAAPELAVLHHVVVAVVVAAVKADLEQHAHVIAARIGGNAVLPPVPEDAVMNVVVGGRLQQPRSDPDPLGARLVAHSLERAAGNLVVVAVPEPHVMIEIGEGHARNPDVGKSGLRRCIEVDGIGRAVGRSVDELDGLAAVARERDRVSRGAARRGRDGASARQDIGSAPVIDGVSRRCVCMGRFEGAAGRPAQGSRAAAAGPRRPGSVVIDPVGVLADLAIRVRTGVTPRGTAAVAAQALRDRGRAAGRKAALADKHVQGAGEAVIAIRGACAGISGRDGRVAQLPRVDDAVAAFRRVGRHVAVVPVVHVFTHIPVVAGILSVLGSVPAGAAAVIARGRRKGRETNEHEAIPKNGF